MHFSHNKQTAKQPPWKQSMNVLFLSSHTFLTKEIENALRKRTDLTLLTMDVPQYPQIPYIETLIDKIGYFLPALVISVNDGGFDYNGVFQKILISKGCLLANWYHDYPFYEEIFHGRVMIPQKETLFFISEESFVQESLNRGFNSFFLPLATDPVYFYSDSDNRLTKDISFVGNSSSFFIDSVITEKRGQEIEKIISLLGMIKKKYYSNPMTNIRDLLISNEILWENKTSLARNELFFLLEWLCGYFYRKDFIVNISQKYQKSFTCFGDADWKHIIDPLQVSTEACYYTTLHEVYKSSKINLNINRIQIRTSFTQRIFDCSACGAFILTDKRKQNSNYFCTEGKQKELVEFSSLEECTSLIDFYLVHEEERIEIAKRAKKNVLENHTYDNRIETMLSVCKKHLSNGYLSN